MTTLELPIIGLERQERMHKILRKIQDFPQVATSFDCNTITQTLLSLFNFCSQLFTINFPCLQPPISKPNHRLVFQTQLSINFFLEIQPQMRDFCKRSMNLENNFSPIFQVKRKSIHADYNQYTVEKNPPSTLLIKNFNPFVY